MPLLEGTENMCRKVSAGSKEAAILDIIGFPHECPAEKVRLQIKSNKFIDAEKNSNFSL